MSEQKESSVLFSLKELMNLEEDRIKNEEADRAAQAAAAEKARLDAERQAREAEEARIRAEEERRRMEEARGREENARLEAIRQAEIEKARVEAEQRARLEAMNAQQHHERSLAAINQDQSKKKLRNMLIAGGIGFVVIAGGGTWAFLRSSAEAQQKQAALAAEQDRLNEEKKKLEAQMKDQMAKQASLIQQLSSAKDEATRLALQKQLDEEKQKTEEMQKARGGGGPRGGGQSRPAGGAGKPCNCAPGDPLCSCL